MNLQNRNSYLFYLSSMFNTVCDYQPRRACILVNSFNGFLSSLIPILIYGTDFYPWFASFFLISLLFRQYVKFFWLYIMLNSTIGTFNFLNDFLIVFFYCDVSKLEVATGMLLRKLAVSALIKSVFCCFVELTIQFFLDA